MNPALCLVRQPADYEAQLLDLLAEHAASVAKTAEIDARVADLCRAYSAAHGYKVVLDRGQMAKEFLYGKGRG